MQIKVTVFTATYNRDYVISRIYDSLLQQTDQSFEWIIVDDGSTDDTYRLVKEWIKENKILIIYKKTSNGGKHRAINKGIKLASGFLFYILDSDDYLPNDAIEKILKTENTIPDDQKSSFCGICGCRFDQNGKLIGKSFNANMEYIDCKSSDRAKYGIYGDKAEVVYTKVLRAFPFPSFENETFCTEAVVWNRIAYHGYKFRYINDKLCICEYQENGLSNNLKKFVRNNPMGLILYTKEYFRFCNVNKKEKILLSSLCALLIEYHNIKNINIKEELNLNYCEYIMSNIVKILRTCLKKY